MEFRRVLFRSASPTVWLPTLWEQAMKKLLMAGARVAIAFSGSACADDDDDDRGWEARKEYQEARREALKDHREAIREYEKDRREYEKDRREDMREAAKDRREAEREWRKDAREYRRWARGEYIPRHYLADRSYMQDYSRHDLRSEEHTSELQSLMRKSYAVICLQNK